MTETPDETGGTGRAAPNEMRDLAQSERRYRRLFEAARDGILLLDVETGCITDANPYLYELLGYAPGTLLGKELWQLGLFDDRAASQYAFRRLHDTGYIRYENLPLETVSGKRCEVEFVSNAYRENGHTVIQCNIRDITGRKQTERALQAALHRELQITEALQYSLTADVAEDVFPGLQIAYGYEPFLREAEVGGDFFDAISVHSNRKRTDGTSKEKDVVAFAVGDVAGKGLIAAAIAGRVKDVTRAFLGENHDPGYTLSRLNEYLCDTVSRVGYQPGLNVNMIMLALSLVVINPRTGITAVGSAGAEPPLIVRKNGETEVVEEPNLLLGVHPGVVYTTRRLHLRKGDTLVMTTDGITEARRSVPVPKNDPPDGPDLLGYEGMLAIAHRNRNASSLGAMCRGIVEDARGFGGHFRDDVCLLLVRRG